jgi:hypothetical protein
VSDLAEARKAYARGSTDAALVALWNAVEPARLAGDRRTLHGIAQLAKRIAAEDEATQHEAERLLEEVREATEGEVVAATDVLDAGVERVEATAADPVREASDEEVAQPSRRARLAPLAWLLVFLVIFLLNALQAR